MEPTPATHFSNDAIQDRFQIGFIRDADSSLVAYAGGRRFPYEGHYVWQIAPETQQTRGELARADAGKALGTAVTALGVVAAFALKVGLAVLGAAAKSGGHN